MSTDALKAAATAGTAVAKAQPTTIQLLEKMKPQLALALPRHMNPDRVLRIVLTEMRKNDKLMKCDSQSVLASVVIAAQLGLEPGINGQGYLIPHKGTCTFVPGWKGLVDLAQRSGRASVWTGAVFTGDEFEYQYGSEPYINHRPGDQHGNPDMLEMVYAVGRVRGAEYPVLEVWSMKKVMHHRDRFNKVGNDHYSFKHPEMYGRKVALLQVLKYMPQSIELATAIDLENAAEAGKQHLDMKDAIEGTFVPSGDQQRDGPIAESEAVELFRAAKTEAELAERWLRVQASYEGVEGGIPIAIEAARNTFRDQLKEATRSESVAKAGK